MVLQKAMDLLPDIRICMSNKSTAEKSRLGPVSETKFRLICIMPECTSYLQTQNSSLK